MKKRVDVRKLVVTAMLAAVSTVLMFFSFNVPLMPGFIKMDFSELPALLASFALGPVSGAAVCLVKNLVNVIFTSTGGVGELSNFILGCLFVVPAGWVYHYKRTAMGALLGSALGAFVMAAVSVLTNYYVVYPIYTAFMSMEAILGMYRAINHNVKNLWDALLWFNMPFTFLKGLCSVAMCFLIYKPLSPILKGTSRAAEQREPKQA